MLHCFETLDVMVMHSKACQAQLKFPFYNVGTTLLFTTTVWLGDAKKGMVLRVGPFSDPLLTIFVSPPSPPLDHAAA